MADFKPQIMPLMYWALAYGAAAGVLLSILWLLSAFITVVWFPVFLVGVIWGGWRNYQRQKKQWYAATGTVPPPQSALNEFRQAASDIAASSQELLNQTEAGEEVSVNDAAGTLKQLPPVPEPPTAENQDEEPLPPGR